MLWRMGRPGPAPLGRLGDRRWLLGLALIMLLGAAVRFTYIHVHTQELGVGDPFYYHEGANLLADGKGFVDPFQYVYEGRTLPGAYHPPGYVVALALTSVFGFTSELAHQHWSALISLTAIPLIALLGRRLAGPRAGLIAAFLAATYPNLWFSDALLMSETLLFPTVAATLLLAYWYWDRPSFGRAAALGVSCGVTALVRSEAVLLVPLLVLPMVAFTRSWSLRRRAGVFLAAGTAAAAVLAPWAVYNLLRFEEPVLLGVSDHTLIAGNCPDRYEGDLIGYWTVSCIIELNCPDPAERRDLSACLLEVRGADASVHEKAYRREALRHIRKNVDRLPLVVLAREGRAFGFFRPGQQLDLDRFATKELGLSRLALGMFYVMAASGVAGGVFLRRRRIPLTPLLAPFAAVAVTVAVTFGETRYRALAEVSLIVLAAVGFEALIRSGLRRRTSGEGRHAGQPDVTRLEQPVTAGARSSVGHPSP
jgi:4-amino-4-deoxy-L-arabinose transferase-like glycosyltransferase